MILIIIKVLPLPLWEGVGGRGSRHRRTKVRTPK